MKNINYMTSGTCSREIRITLADDNTIDSIEIIGGCSGNLKGIASLLKGMDANAAIERMHGIKCGSKPTSCPDQIAKALIQIQSEG